MENQIPLNDVVRDEKIVPNTADLQEDIRMSFRPQDNSWSYIIFPQRGVLITQILRVSEYKKFFNLFAPDIEAQVRREFPDYDQMRRYCNNRREQNRRSAFQDERSRQYFDLGTESEYVANAILFGHPKLDQFRTFFKKVIPSQYDELSVGADIVIEIKSSKIAVPVYLAIDVKSFASKGDIPQPEDGPERLGAIDRNKIRLEEVKNLKTYNLSAMQVDNQIQFKVSNILHINLLVSQSLCSKLYELLRNKEGVAIDPLIQLQSILSIYNQMHKELSAQARALLEVTINIANPHDADEQTKVLEKTKIMQDMRRQYVVAILCLDEAIALITEKINQLK
ncbi:hypothetical protein IT409_01940 [Candidatus Falkowbacteria bacterium]|nr:hypothetical protein [Candidatus Falkowbacteria bacterium]